MTTDWTRRQVLGQAGVALAGAAGLGLAGCASAATRPATRPARKSGVQSFVSRPDLSPPGVSVSGRVPASSPGYILLTPDGASPRQGGAMILDTRGDLVWFSPDSAGLTIVDLKVQTYRGKPVLTWYQGPIVEGHGEGVAVIADSSYRPLHTVRAARGLKVDLHEFVLTPQGTALITCYRRAPADLSALGGPARGAVWSSVVQEIDLATGRLLFAWDSLDHVPVTDSYLTFSGGTSRDPFDYFHINSIALAPDGDLIISARHTWAIYKITRPGGAIEWRLGGKKSSFTMGAGTRFSWQHHARPHGASTLSVFDDGAGPQAEEKQSRAIVLDLDTAARHATLRRQYVHPGKRLLAEAMGSAQLLPDGGMFTGWGTERYFSEFSADGELLLDGAMTPGHSSYRAFTAGWAGHPAERPAAAVRAHRGTATVYASWNGATNVAAWTVLAGKSAAALTAAGSAPRTGFETAITVHAKGPYFAVVPLDSAGHPLTAPATIHS